MKQQNLKKSKLIYVLISIVAAIFLWVYVVTVVSTEQSATFYKIPVTYSGVEMLKENGLTITNGMDKAVSLRLSGRRTLIQQLNNENIIITVDVSKINAAGTYDRGYTISYSTLPQNSGINVEMQAPQSIEIVVEDLLTREIPVKAVFQGTTEDDYVVDSVIAAYDSITVIGTHAQIGDIDKALIIVDEEDLNRTMTAEYSYTLVNADGDPIDSSDIVVDVDRVSVTVNVVKFKEIPLIMAFNPGGGATDANVDWEAMPSTITVSGDEDVLDDLNYILLGTKNLSELVADTYETYPIVIPDGVTNETGTAEASVSMKLSGLTSKKVTISGTSSFTLINVPTGYVANAVTQSLEVTVRGPSEDISTVLPSDLRIVADLSGLTAASGTYKIENVAVYLDNHPNSGIMGSYNVSVTMMTEAEYLEKLEEEERAKEESEKAAQANP